MSRLKSIILTAMTMLAGIGPALAADPQVSVTVTAVPNTASFSRAAVGGTEVITTNSAYQMRVVNDSINTLNKVRIHGEAEFANGVRPTYVDSFYLGVIGLSCTSGIGTSAITGNPVTTVDCSIGQLRGSGGASPFIVVIFETPKAPLSPVGCTVLNNTQYPAVPLDPAPAACDRIDFNWTAFYSEGSNDAGGASHADNTPGVTRTSLGTVTATSVNTFARGINGEFFYTGGKQHATLGDPWVTLFTVPLTAQAIVNETDTFQSCLGVLSCWISAMSVKDLNGNKALFSTCSATNLTGCLKVTLRRDATTIGPGAKIEDAIISYSPSGNFSDVIPLPACGTQVTIGMDVMTYPFLDHPCIGARKAYPKKTVNPDDSQDWEFDIYGFDNGSFRG